MELIQREGYVFTGHECLIIQRALEIAIERLSKINKEDKDEKGIPQTSLALPSLQKEMEILKDGIGLLVKTKEEPGVFSKETIDKMFTDKKDNK